MKTLTSESYSIAWFKLADFVARGEKERALNLLRLLMHSVSDKALTYQLEGDILRAFQDSIAIDRYLMAAELYHKVGKIQQAISSYHHAISFQENEKTLLALLQIYLVLQNKTGILKSFSKFAQCLISTKSSQHLINVTYTISENLSLELQIMLHTQLTISLLLNDPTYEKISDVIKKTIDLFKQNLKINKKSSSNLQMFLTELKALDLKKYETAELYLKES